jgi:hypothetical protein
VREARRNDNRLGGGDALGADGRGEWAVGMVDMPLLVWIVLLSCSGVDFWRRGS